MERNSVSRIALTLILFGMLVLEVRIQPAEAQTREVGVKIGDWAKYDVAINYTTNDPNPPIQPPPPEFNIEYLRVEVKSIMRTVINFQFIIRLKNGTERSELMSTDVTGPSLGTFFVGANLSIGDALYPYPFSPVINYAIMRTYAGMERDVNYVQTQSNVGPVGYYVVKYEESYWDKASGIIAEYNQTVQYEKIVTGRPLTHETVHVVMRETNIWSPTVISVEVGISPNSLNLRSKGKWIMAFIELPSGYSVSHIIVSSILLNDTVSAQHEPAAISDYDNDTIPDLMVKFDRTEVISYIFDSVNVKERFMTVALTVAGKLNDGTRIEGNGAIKIIYIMPKRDQSTFPI